MSIAIAAKGLSKAFLVKSSSRLPYETLRDRITGWYSNRNKVSLGEAPGNDRGLVRALENVSFEIKSGERIGLIGRNGAGKSTLLKVLSRVTEPSSGHATIRGRMAALLEVGTGFHQELTGRENVFLYAAIMGMRHREVRKRIDEIAEFADIGNFIDIPVKRYSSGMYVRLAFAAASHLDPDIWVIDEVLAVGDAGFQKKCIHKLKEKTTNAGTVILVSHNLQLVRSFCSRSILMDKGKILLDGPTEQVLATYHKEIQKGTDLNVVALESRLKTRIGFVRFSHFAAQNEAGEESWTFKTGQTVRFRLGIRTTATVTDVGFSLFLRSAASGEVIAHIHDVLFAGSLSAGVTKNMEIHLPQFPLLSGEYRIQVLLTEEGGTKIHDEIDDEMVGLPWLLITPGDRDKTADQGYLRISSKILNID